MCLEAERRLCAKGDRGTDEDARRRGQSPARSNVSASTDCTGENGGRRGGGSGGHGSARIVFFPTRNVLFQILVKSCWTRVQIRQTPTSCCEYSRHLVQLHPSDQATDSTAHAPPPRVYSEISSQQQRQSYKQEFNRDYSEYRLLHARIDSVTQQFMELNTQLQQLSRESCKYKVRRRRFRRSSPGSDQSSPFLSVQEVHDQIIQAYQKIKKVKPRIRAEVLAARLFDALR